MVCNTLEQGFPKLAMAEMYGPRAAKGPMGAV